MSETVEMAETVSKIEEEPNDISPDKNGGVLKLVKQEGTGEDMPLPGCEVFVHYTGTLLNGEKFDSSRDRGELFKFKLGQGQVIKAWDVGVATMRKGEICILTCAAEFAYGEKGSPPTIPPNATLVFEVELFDWQDELITDDGGVTKAILLNGDGYSKPNEDAAVSIHLRGTYEGNVFEEKDVNFLLGEGSEHGVVEGVEKALYKMLLREKARINITSTYGYGTKGHSDFGIPPNADLTYEIYLSSFEKAKEGYSMDLNEKLEMSDRLKDKGTKLFKAGEYSKALHQYQRMIKCLDTYQDEEKAQTTPKKCVAHLNAALCNLKLTDFFHAREQCDKALEIENKNVKGLFRRGQAQLGLNDFDLAKKDFIDVLEIEPNNKAARGQLNIVKSKLKYILDKEKKTYCNMFDRFALVDEKKEQIKKKTEKTEDVLKAAEDDAIRVDDALEKAEEESKETTADQASANGEEVIKVEEVTKKAEVPAAVNDEKESTETPAEQTTVNGDS